MSDRRNSLSDLLLLSGIDLLLASLCVSVGLLVLFLSSDASGSNKEALLAKPYERWWTLVVSSPKPPRYDLSCAAGAIKPADFADEGQAIYFGNEWEKGACTLTVESQATVDVTLYSNTDCWNLLDQDADGQCNAAQPDNQIPIDIRVLPPLVPSAPTPGSRR